VSPYDAVGSAPEPPATAAAAEVAWVDGMRCGGCALRLEERLRSLDGVERADVSYATGRVSVWWQGHPAREAFALALREEGLAARQHSDASGDQEEDDRDKGAHTINATRAAVGVALAMVAATPVWSVRLLDDAPAMLDRLALPASAALLLLSMKPIVLPGLRQWWARRPGMDALIVVGALASFAAAAAALFTSAPLETLDAGAMLLALRLVGIALERRARDAGARALREALSERTVVRRGGVDTPPAALSVGDTIDVTAGALLPVDARLLALVPASSPADRTEAADAHAEPAALEVDESAITGEPAPRRAVVGSSLSAGVRLIHSDARFVVERTFAEGRLGQLAEDVVTAASSRPEVQRRADRVARALIVAMLGLAPLVGAAVLAAGGSVGDATVRAIAVLVVTCPCALALATPLVVLFATSSAARRGLIIRNADVFERMAAVRHIVFDKTGTLTDAALSVDGFQSATGRPKDAVLSLAASVAQGSLHPVARALVAACPGAPVGADVREIAGLGIEGEVGGRRVRVGRPAWTTAPTPTASAWPGAPDDDGATWVTEDGAPLGAFSLSSQLHPQTTDTVRGLHARKLTLSVASGDADDAVQQVAADLEGISDAAGRLLPHEKAAHVAARREDAGQVAFVGDGLNDAPALAAADVGIAARGLLEATAPLADVRLLDAGPQAVVTLVDVARHAARRMRINLAWAIGYNLLAVPAAAAGLIGPSVAAIAMVASSMSVVLYAARFEASLQRRENPEPC
jgi:heavy metal translocating P-type ATPase